MTTDRKTAMKYALELRAIANDYHLGLIDHATLSASNGVIWDALAKRPRTANKVRAILRGAL